MKMLGCQGNIETMPILSITCHLDNCEVFLFFFFVKIFIFLDLLMVVNGIRAMDGRCMSFISLQLNNDPTSLSTGQ